MNRFCHSCGMPLTEETSRGGDYCNYCVNESGDLHPKSAVQKGVSEWLLSWSPDLDRAEAEKRAERYMSAMPAWAGK